MPALINLKGKRFGKLVVLERAKENKRGKPAWVCKCDCGNILDVAGSDLRQIDCKSCGCYRKTFKLINLKGKKFGKLKAIEIVENRGKSTAKFWRCKCDCGNFHIVSSQHLRLRQVKSCGCLFNKSDEILLKEAKDRFFKNIEKIGDCWIWKGRVIKSYGMMYFKHPMRAHRFSYMIHKGELKKDLFICHHCDTPLCVNPDHLYQGSPKENSKDAYDRKRMVVGEKHHYAKLKKDEVEYILSSNEKGIDLAKKYKVSEDTISRIRTRRSWKNTQ